MRSLAVAVLALAALLVLPASHASADQPEGSTYRQEQSTIGNAGHTATGTTYVNRGTLGQPTPLGTADGSDTYNEPGFWHAPEEAADDDSGDDDGGDDDGGDDDGEDDDISDDDTSSDDDTGADDDDDSGRDVCACRYASGPPPVPTTLLILLGFAVVRRLRRV